MEEALRADSMGMGMAMKATKSEEVLEIKALRKIISAYLNYSDAAEADVRRWERSYARLPPKHKALLAHLPKKHQQLRRCIAANSFFVLNMLQAFEPPFDMSQDCESCEYEDIGMYNENRDDSQTIPAEAQQFYGMQGILDGHAEGTQTDSCHEYHVLKEQDLLATDRMLNTCAKELPSRGSRSGEADLNLANVQDEWNLYQGPCPSVNCGSTSSTKDDNRLSADFGSDGSKSSNGEPNIRGKIPTEVFNDHSTYHSIPTSNGEKNCMGFDWKDPAFQLHVSPADVDKVRCIVRNIVRDWAPEGETERNQCYKPILEELERQFPSHSRDRSPSCLVPGAGLGRLALEISRLGFISQGNEFSYYMMICSSFILNHTRESMEWVIYPWIHSNCNSLSDKDQLRPIYFPDLHPGSAGITEGFSMCAGDFVEVYSDPSQSGTWDAVTTCFFIDTAHNVVEYIEIISNILKDGGVWINHGPLLYHFADAYAPEDEMSIELSLEDVKRIAFHYGFELETERTIETTYTANPTSMMQNRYFAAFWTMRKKGSTPKGVPAKEL